MIKDTHGLNVILCYAREERSEYYALDGDREEHWLCTDFVRERLGGRLPHYIRLQVSLTPRQGWETGHLLFPGLVPDDAPRHWAGDLFVRLGPRKPRLPWKRRWSDSKTQVMCCPLQCALLRLLTPSQIRRLKYQSVQVWFKISRLTATKQKTL